MHTTLPDRSTLPYRKKSNAIIFNSDDHILLVQTHSYNEDEWNLPGGGIEPGESPQEGILRELLEELGTDKFDILEQSGIENAYDFPDEVLARAIAEGRPFRGQHQTQFLVRFVGEDTDIVIQDAELRQYKWVPVSDLEGHLLFPGQLQNVLDVIEASEVMGHLVR